MSDTVDYSKLWNNYIDLVFSNLNVNEVESNTYNKENIIITSKIYSGTNYIKSRETFIYSDNLSIYNNIIYPKTGKNLPCFGIDLMAFMENKVIIVFDFQHPKEHHNFTHDIVHEYLNGYENNTEKIRFFEPGNHFSKYIFVRKCSVHQVNDYLTDFKKYILSYKKMIEFENPIETNTEEYVDFDTYMHKLDPVGGFMRSKFGKDFAEDYVNNFLFPYAKI
jgi:hypothetical protein